MLHIKLPKGKVSQACDRLATMLEMKYAHDIVQYEAIMEAWSKDQKAKRDAGHNDRFFVMPPRYHGTRWVDAKTWRERQTACMASAGDVYVSHEMWDKIKGHYDV